MKTSSLLAARRLAPCSLVLLLCASCNLAPKYHQPAAETPTAFKEAAGPSPAGTGWKVAEPKDDRIRPKWWELYGDPQLSALEEKVSISNQTILAAEANFRASRAMVVAARSALFPTVTGAPSFTRERTSTTTRAGTVTAGAATTSATTTSSTTTAAASSSSTTSAASSLGPNPSNVYAVPFDASYEVDLWDRVHNTISAAAATAQASAADVATALLSTQAQLAEDYFQVRTLDEEQHLFTETIEAYRQDVNLTRTLYQTGIDSDEDLANAETQLATVTAQATDVGVARAQYEHAIAVLIGQAPANFSIAPLRYAPEPPVIPVAVPSVLLERRPDISSAERQVRAANAQIGVARAAYFPALTLSASAGFESSGLSQLFTWPSRFWSFGPQLAGTLFDGGARRAQTEQAEAAYDQTVANYRQTVLAGFQAVEDNLAALRILSAEAAQQKVAVAAANKYLSLAMTRYRTGIDSYLNVTTAQTTVLTNRQTELQIQLKRMNASVALVMALGGSWESDQMPTSTALLTRPPTWSPAK